MSTCQFLRHAAIVCENAARGLPIQFANGRPLQMPNSKSQAEFVRRARHYRRVADRIDGDTGRFVDQHAPRILPAASSSTGIEEFLAAPDQDECVDQELYESDDIEVAA